MLLQDLYNKVMGFFRQTDIEQEESSKETACNRLRVVLMQDRTNLTPELLERMRGELVELLSKYLEMDKEALELNLEQDGDQVALMLSIPVIRAKDEEEIKAALEKSEKESEEISDENSDKNSDDNSIDRSTEDNESENKDELDDETDEDFEKSEKDNSEDSKEN